jgi:hypothetical protein
MEKLVLHEPWLSALRAVHSQSELCDETGKTLGYFLTVAEYERMVLDWVKLRYPPEEVARLRQQQGGRTTAEVLARLRQK